MPDLPWRGGIGESLDGRVRCHAGINLDFEPRFARLDGSDVNDRLDPEETRHGMLSRELAEQRAVS